MGTKNPGIALKTLDNNSRVYTTNVVLNFQESVTIQWIIPIAENLGFRPEYLKGQERSIETEIVSEGKPYTEKDS
jgi:hypothetical protein